MLGSLLAMPVGLGSAYSMYRANFSVEATCKSLRANIVSMLDKNVDAGTRHMLVRRDVEAFEHTCGTVDPDATTAFKALLAADKAPRRRDRGRSGAARAEAQPKPAVRKTEPRPQASRQSRRPRALPPLRPSPLAHDAGGVRCGTGSMRCARPWSRIATSGRRPMPRRRRSRQRPRPLRSLHSKRRPCRHLLRYLHRQSPRRRPRCCTVAPALPPPATVAAPPRRKPIPIIRCRRPRSRNPLRPLTRPAE